MTKRNWDRANERIPDPARVIEITHSGERPIDDSAPYEPKRVRAKRLRKEREERYRRSEEIRLEALAEKKKAIADNERRMAIIASGKFSRD